MKSRLLALLLVMVVMLGAAVTVSAQGMDPCLGLSASDCQILSDADAKVGELTNFTQSFKFSLDIGGLAMLAPGMNAINISANASNSPFVIDVAKATADDPTAALAMAMDLNGSISGTGEGDSAGSFSFVIVDGVFYMKNPENGQWMGIKLAELVEAAGSQGLPFDPQALLEGDTSGMEAIGDPTEALSALGLGDIDLMALINTPGFLGQQRVADASANGQAQYAFESSIDFGALFKSPDFQKLVNNALQAAAEQDPEAAQMAMLLPMFLQSSEASVKLTRWIGQSDLFLHRLVLEINANVDLNVLAGGASSGGAQMEPITLNMVLDVQLSQHNATAAPAAPAGAEMVPTEALMSGM